MVSLESLLAFAQKYIHFQSLLLVYLWPRKEIQMPFKNRFKLYLKYTSLLNSWCTQSILKTYKLKLKYIDFEGLLQVYLWPRKEIKMPFNNRFNLYLKYTSLLNSWCTQSILETWNVATNLNYFFSVTNFGNQKVSKSILEVYFIFRVQKYNWSIAQFLQAKILIKVYVIYEAMA